LLMRRSLSVIFPLFLFSLIPTILIWLPFFLRVDSVFGIPIPKEGMATIAANYDGPLYILVSKTLYDFAQIGSFPFTLPYEYYAAHFPLFPLLIRGLSYAVNAPYALLIVTLVSSFASVFAFYYFIKEFVSEKNALWVTFLFSIFPARWLIVRSVGSPEPLFIASVLGALYYFRKGNYWAAGLLGAVAQWTKSPGILLFIGMILAVFIERVRMSVGNSLTKSFAPKELLKILPLFLIPLSLIGVFALFQVRMGNFWAYFNSGDNIHLFFPPFQIFNYSQPWVGTFWLEEIIFIYLLGILTLTKLISMKEERLYWFYGIFLVSLFFVSHRDLLRYALPIVPLSFVAFSDLIIKKEFKIATAILLIPIYLYSLAYISQNVMPISDWSALI
jgi:Gpi18-like mannosyltransferase